MKKYILLLIATLVVTTANAQQKDAAAREKQRQEMIQKRAANLVKAMKITDEDEAWFKQLYTEYQDSLNTLRQSLRPEGQPEEVSGMKEMKQISDLQASQMLLNQFNMEEQQVAVKRAYYEKFKERLTPKQLMLVFMGPANNGGGAQRGQRNNDMQQGGMMPPPGMGGFPGGGRPF